MMKELLRISRFISDHPLASKRKYLAYKRFIGWQLSQKMVNHPVLYPFVEDSVLLIEKGMTGATGNIYTGLLEFNDMSFVLHALRKGDLFADVGANVGVYSVLASRNAGADTVALEPIPSTFIRLKRNVDLNEIGGLVKLMRCGVGETAGVLRFTSADDTVNHVVSEGESLAKGDIVEVEVKTLDSIFAHEIPAVVKMDIEGFELPALRGASKLLSSPSLKALIIELNGSGARYGFEDSEILALLTSFGFKPFHYDPFTRTFESTTDLGNTNVLFIKDIEWASSRCKGARKFTILQQDI